MICNIHKFRDKMRAGRVCLGTGISFTDPAASEALCESVDFLWIDLEHSPISLESLQAHLMAARAGGAPAIDAAFPATTSPGPSACWTLARKGSSCRRRAPLPRSRPSRRPVAIPPRVRARLRPPSILELRPHQGCGVFRTQ